MFCHDSSPSRRDRGINRWDVQYGKELSLTASAGALPARNPSGETAQCFSFSRLALQESAKDASEPEQLELPL